MNHWINYFVSVPFLVNAAEIVIIVAVVFLFYRRFIYKTSSEKFVHGLIGLAGMWMASWIFEWLGLNILGVFMRWVAMFLSIGLVVIFQPELRQFLGMMGHVNFMRTLFSPHFATDASTAEKSKKSVDEILKATEYMSRAHTGALMVFSSEFGGGFEKAGVKINADITSELLLTIFFNKTPLHDGAVVISGNRIVSAGTILPLTENKDLNWRYGTRHRAAIGMSENSNAHVLVVSEETGDISIAYNGAIKKYDTAKKLRTELGKIFGI
ncbi:MAG: diadenylate cyclase CdaA [Proteobacteria bacterium]|nr:diadenylate cyclase CdaA [Pseudomonadota bacterium]